VPDQDVANGSPSITFIANGGGDSAAAERARRIAQATNHPTQVVHREHGRIRSIANLVRRSRTARPDLVYCVDLAAVPVATAVLTGRHQRFVVDTGDYPSAFLAHIDAGRARISAARALETLTYRKAEAIVVRGRFHEAVVRERYQGRVEVIPDGVDLDLVQPVVDARLRASLGLADVLTVGIAGHFTWYDKLGGGLGWEVVNALAALPGAPVHAVFIGDGPGLPRLRLLAAQLGVADRVHILGRVPYTEYGRYLGVIDVCILTQTDDPASWVRTTGKLPGYLAAGRYVLASAVGSAVDVLPEEMLIPYDGRWDVQYPMKLADRLRRVVERPTMLRAGLGLRAKAEDFDYRVIAARAAALLDELL
jgi:glycosyltransferase involved in cell wall biosynthesis